MGGRRTDITIWRANFPLGTTRSIGSVPCPQLFTDLAIMKLVERGDLDLDAPVSDVLTSFKPESDFDEAITLRQLMSHRSGLLREPPVGPLLRRHRAPLLSRPWTHLTRRLWSPRPAASASTQTLASRLVGRVLETATQQPFEAAVTDLVLRPLAMTSSSFSTPVATERVPDAAMWTSFGSRVSRTYVRSGHGASRQPLHLARGSGRVHARTHEARCNRPAGNLPRDAHASVCGTGGLTANPHAPALAWGLPSTSWMGERRIGHGGAIYGFATTQLAVLPERGFRALRSLPQRTSATRWPSRIADSTTLQQLLSSETPPAATRGPFFQRVKSTD